MKIVYLSQYFPPEMGAPAARVFELSREWAASGHDVTVVTGFPNHPTGVIPAEYRGSMIRRELVDGIDVLRVPIYATPNSGRVRRSMSYVSFAASATALSPFLTRKPDVVIATSPQLLNAVAGAALSTVKRTPFVFEVRDIWPQSIVAVGALKQDHPAIWALERLELALYRRADRVVVVTDSFVSELEARGVPAAKMRVVKNGVDLDLFRPSARDEALRAEFGIRAQDVMCLYVGTHGMAHGLGTMLDAAEILRDRGDVRFVFVGEGADKPRLKEDAQRRRLNNVIFVDKQPRERIPAFLAASDLNLVLLKRDPLFKTVLPSKIFEILGAGRPVILGVDGEARALMEQSGGGVFVTPEDAAGLAEQILSLAANVSGRMEMGARGRAFVEAHFSRRALAQKYLEILKEVVDSGANQDQAA